MDATQNFLSEALLSYRNCKSLAERALDQTTDEHFFLQLDEESNSIAIIVKHIAGNLHSRWRDFLTTDGEKPDRRRETEFELIDDTRDSLMNFWESGWQTLFEAVEPLRPADLTSTVTIRGEPHTVLEAINRQLTHYSYHVGQIVFLAKHFRSAEWQTLSVPRNRSDEFNARLAEQHAKGSPTSGRFDAAQEFRDEK